MDFERLTTAANSLRHTGHNDLALVCEAAKQRIEQLERTMLAAAVTIEQLQKDLDRMDQASKS